MPDTPLPFSNEEATEAAELIEAHLQKYPDDKEMRWRVTREIALRIAATLHWVATERVGE